MIPKDGKGIRLPGRREPLAPDDRLARPEAGEEYVDGQRIEVMAGEPEHADPQCNLAYVVRACVAEDYVASTELLTRTDKGSDFATDVCVRRRGTNPKTGGRFLEEVSFEVAHTQTRAELERDRVPKLVAAGVRRIFRSRRASRRCRCCPRGGRCRPRRAFRPSRDRRTASATSTIETSESS